MQECSHDSFCSACLAGKSTCPLCKEAILGWKLLQRNPMVNPFLASLGGECDAILDPMLPKSKHPKQFKEIKAGTMKTPTEDALVVEEEDLNLTGYDSDELGQGVQVWCSDDDFKKGGARSKEFFHNSQNEEECDMRNHYEDGGHRQSPADFEIGRVVKEKTLSALLPTMISNPAIIPNS